MMRQKAKSPAFQFYPADFLGSGAVGMMTPFQVGIYILLLALDWNAGGFEYRAADLARWCRTTEPEFQEAWKTVEKCFRLRTGKCPKYFNPRLEKERKKQRLWQKKSRDGGVNSGTARRKGANQKAKGGSTTLTLKGEPNTNTLFASLSSTSVTALTTNNNNSGDISARQAVRDLLPNDTARIAFDELVNRATGKLTFVAQVQCLGGAIPSTLPCTYSWAEIGSAMIDLAQSGGPVQRLPSFCRTVRQRAADTPPDTGDAFMRLMHAERAPQVPFAVWLASQTAPTEAPEQVNATA